MQHRFNFDLLGIGSANTLLFAEGWHPVLLSSQEHPGQDRKDARVTAEKPAGAERWLLWASNPF
jgi:hypothetical protein